MRVVVVALALLVACDGGPTPHHGCELCDGPPWDVNPVCNPLSQLGCQYGEKCAWIIDATVPTYVGHVGCVPDGSEAVGSACDYGTAGATGYDNCSKGSVCSAYQQPGTQGVCKAVCDNQGGNPMCDASHVCVTYSRLFSTGATSPAAAGVCDVSCDPLADNDFDGSAGPLTKGSNTCGSDFHVGCYGVPSGGTPPVTGWSCTGDFHSDPDKGLRHRVECTTATGCAEMDSTIFPNSCNQGYLPLFRESTAVSTAICVAMCAPLDCYAGNCGSNDENRHGGAPHRCMEPDAVGSFGSGEECEYLWAQELDGSGHWLPSPTSNTVGFCFDHSMYMYDPTGGTNYTTPIPSCKDLPLHGSGSALGADDLGCVSTTTAGVMSARNHRPDLPRTLYHRVMR